MSTTFKTPVKSRRGLSFFVGFIGAYLVPIGLNNLLVAFGLRETLSATNTEYIAYGVSGLVLGYACMSITPVHRVRILSYLIGSILVMEDHLVGCNQYVELGYVLFSQAICCTLRDKLIGEEEIVFHQKISRFCRPMI